jgi:hypothetical protein
MGLVIPPPVHLPQAQPQQPVQPKPEVVAVAQVRPIATQTQRAVPGPSRARGGEGAKSEEKAADIGQAQRQRRRDGGITIDV